MYVVLDLGRKQAGNTSHSTEPQVQSSTSSTVKAPSASSSAPETAKQQQQEQRQDPLADVEYASVQLREGIDTVILGSMGLWCAALSHCHAAHPPFLISCPASSGTFRSTGPALASPHSQVESLSVQGRLCCSKLVCDVLELHAESVCLLTRHELPADKALLRMRHYYDSAPEANAGNAAMHLANFALHAVAARSARLQDPRMCSLRSVGHLQVGAGPNALLQHACSGL